MRKIDVEKRNKVTQAVLQITMEDGLAGLSFDKLAKRGGVSSGTPYVYYRDKTDMLSCIYAQVWQALQEGLQTAIDSGRTTGEKLFFGLRHLAQMLLNHPQEAHFLLSVLNAPEFVTAGGYPPAADENRQYHVYQCHTVWTAFPDSAAAPAEYGTGDYERGGKGAGSGGICGIKDPVMLQNL